MQRGRFLCGECALSLCSELDELASQGTKLFRNY